MENGLVMSQELKQKQTLSAYQYQSLHILHLGNAQVGELLKKESLHRTEGGILRGGIPVAGIL